MRSRSVLTLLVLCGGVFFSGCASDSPTGPGSDESRLIAPETSAVLGTAIGVLGGVVDDGSARLTVPAGALTGWTEMSLSTQLVDGGYQVAMSPNGLGFLVPAVVRLPKPPNYDPNAVYCAFRWDAGLGDWVAVGGVDAGAAILTTVLVSAPYVVMLGLNN